MAGMHDPVMNERKIVPVQRLKPRQLIAKACERRSGKLAVAGRASDQQQQRSRNGYGAAIASVFSAEW